jgi:hypothetical protein
MPLFPRLNPAYYSDGDNLILTRMEAFYADSISINQSFWQEGDTDTRFECGDQTLWNDIYASLPTNRRRQFNFNRIRRVINMISGYQRRNRKSTIVTPIENGDDLTADQFTKVLLWANQQEGVLETVSQSFHGALVTGMNLLQVWVDYRNDPISGNIKVDNCSYNSFLIDPFFRKTDLSDCNGIWKRTFLKKREAISLMPEHRDTIMGLTGEGNRDGKFQFMPETYNFTMNNLLTYDEFYYRDFRQQTMVIDVETGESMEWKGDKDTLKEFLSLYPQVTSIEQEIPTVKMAIVVQGRVLYDGPNPLGIDKYPFVPVLGYYNPQMPYFPWRVQGVVRGLRDSQYLYNRRMIIGADILESQINSGWKFKENALVNPKDIYLTGQGRGLALKEEAQMSDVEQIQAPQIPPSMFQLAESLANEITQISGVNEELLGSATDDKAGILSMLRQGAGLTTLQILFDQLDLSQKLLGKIMIDIIQANFTPNKIEKIIGQQPSQEFYNKKFGRYDAAIEEGLNTTTQKQMQFAQLLQLREMGVPIPNESLLESCTLQNKPQLIEQMRAQEQAQQQQAQAQSESQMQLQMAQIKLAQAQAVADQGLGLERISRVQENEAVARQKEADSEKEHATAILTMAKAVKELEGIDLAHLEKLIQLTQVVKQQEKQNMVDSQIRSAQSQQELMNQVNQSAMPTMGAVGQEGPSMTPQG